MAQFLKIPTLSFPAGIVGETLIPVSKITAITAVNEGAGDAGLTTIVVRLDSSATSLYTIKVLSPKVPGIARTTRENDATDSFNAALIANAGGIVSTVIPPLTTAQNPLSQAGSGRQTIISQEVREQFRSCIFTP